MKNILKNLGLKKDTKKTPDKGYIIKTAVCALAFFASMAVFSLLCRDLINDYSLILMPSKQATIPWLIRLGISIVILGSMTGVAAVLIRPLWMALLVYLAGAFFYPFLTGFGNGTLIIGGVLFLCFSLYLSRVSVQLKNQINFSVHPLSDMKMLFFTVLAAVICATFAFGYSIDSTKGGYVFPPKMKVSVTEMLFSQAKKAAEGQKLAPAELEEAMKQMKVKADEMVNDWEKKLEPKRAFIPAVLGVLLFFLIQVVFLLVSFLSFGLTAGLFFILRITRFANVMKKTGEISFLTLGRVDAVSLKNKK